VPDEFDHRQAQVHLFDTHADLVAAGRIAAGFAVAVGAFLACAALTVLAGAVP